jgi:5-formyltetrahydrofolate cyclo-ligase
MQDKKTFRKIYREKREQIPAALRREESARILTALRQMPLYRNSRKIFTYYSVNSEVDTLDFIQAALSEGKEIYLPVCGKNHTMSLHQIHNLDDVMEGAYQIPVPADQTQPLNPEKLDLVIVPGLSFDRQGYRMGYGGGYYDRFLSCLRPGIAVGVCYTGLLVPEVPRDAFDQKCDWILTGDEVIAL